MRERHTGASRGASGRPERVGRRGQQVQARACEARAASGKRRVKGSTKVVSKVETNVDGLSSEQDGGKCGKEVKGSIDIMEIQTSGRPIDTLLEKVLCMNILSSDYFKELYRLKTYHEVIDEIYNQVDHVEPWMTGNCRGPSITMLIPSPPKKKK
ncbi:Pre-mRNA-splicing factor 38B [Ananas comosus]|uniref:Pre-mRNA-splicing factor 38 n=1 Tax=Ananas comosus TaxID=4615 RepID=A0A199W0W8_ANACO|nr:Pre-mRNA-splicing factor 38B [Ananas comosus]